MYKLSLVVVLVALAGAIYGKTKDFVNMGLPLPPVVELGADTSICPGDTLLLDATVPGNATYLWQDGSTAPTFSVTQEGAYSVTVTEGGESAADTINVSLFDVPQIDLGADTTLCLGDSLVLDVSQYGVTVLWPDGTRGDRYTVYNSTRVGIEVRTRDGCVVSDVIQVTFVPKPPVDLGEDIEICEGESAVLDASVTGNVTYTWSDGNTQAIRTEMTGGTYAVTVSDRGCAASDTVDVTVNAVPTVDLGPADTVVCGAEPLILDLSSAGGSVLWSDGSTGNTLTVSNSGQVWARVSNSICSASDTIDVTLVSFPDVNIGPAQQEICEGETATFDATVMGSVTYTWQDGTTGPVYSTSNAGQYIVTVDDRGCVAQDTVQLSVTPLPQVDLSADTSICGNESLLLDLSDVSGTITWPDGSTGPTYTVTQSGPVQVQVTENNCSVTEVIDVSLKPSPPVDLGADNRNICEGETVTLDATVPGTASYSWSDGITQASRTVAQSGLYIVTVDDGECTASDSVEVVVQALPMVDLGGTDTLICDRESLQFDLSSLNGTITWPDGSTGPTYTVTSSGIVQVQVTENNCSATDQIQVNFGDSPQVDLGPESVSLCQDDPYVIQTQDPTANYTWNDGSTKTSLTVNNSGTYWVIAEKEGCTSSDTIDVELTPVPQINLGGSIDACEGEPVTLDAGNPGATITWQDGTSGPLFTVVESGTYSVTVEEGACLVQEQVSVQFRFTPEVDLGEDLSACSGEVITLEPFVSNADVLRWQDGSSGFSLQVSSSGLYWLEAEVDGCTDRDSVFVTFQEPPFIDLGEDRAICDDQATILRAGSSEDNVRWSTGDVGNVLRVESSGLYWAEVNDGVCAARDSVQLDFLPCGLDNVFVPSAFSPNGDDTNEELLVFIHPEYEVIEYQLYIFDRWGEIVFETQDPTAGWDGRIGGIQAHQGVYVYMIEITYRDGIDTKSGVKAGDVAIVR